MIMPFTRRSSRVSLEVGNDKFRLYMLSVRY